MIALLLATSASWAPAAPHWTPHARASCVLSLAPPPVFLTREDGKNGKLRKLLDERGVASEELPCIAAEVLPGAETLCEVLTTGGHGCIVLTSPEAATVFLDAWRKAGQPPLTPLATVGAGTAAVIEAAGLAASFVPSKATGKTLAAELPPPTAADADAAVLYPASALAANVVADGLASRGIGVRRIDTYTTVAAEWSVDELARAKAARVVTFASPSAVRTWAERAGVNAAAICIGETSAAECRRVGFAEVRCPDKPGVGSWADAVAEWYQALAAA